MTTRTLTSGLLRILPSRSPCRLSSLALSPLCGLLVSRRTCSVVFLWCTWVGAWASVDPMLLAVLRILRAPLLRSWCLVWCMSSTVAYPRLFCMICALPLWEAVQRLLTSPLFLALVKRCSWSCLLLSKVLLCRLLPGWSRSSHPCWRCSCQGSWRCCRLWDHLLVGEATASECLQRACWLLLVLRAVGGHPRSRGWTRCLLVSCRRWVHWPNVAFQAVVVFLPSGFAMLPGCFLARRWPCWASTPHCLRGCRTLSAETWTGLPLLL